MRLSGEYIIGVDIGTTMIKSALIDFEGNEICLRGEVNESESPQPGWGEQDMNRVWDKTKLTILRLIGETGLSKDQIRAIGITGQGQGTWLIDKEGNPVRPAILWLDGRTADIVSKWHTEGRSHKLFEHTGSVLTTSSQPGQLYWLQRNEPDVLEKSKVAFYCKDWIFYKLTGVISTDESDVSHEYFEIADRKYSDLVFDLCEIDRWQHLLPEHKPSHRNISQVSHRIAEELGLKKGTPVVAGPLDVCASGLGVGAIDDGEVSTIIGTAGINQMVMNEPLTQPTGVGLTICYGPPKTWLRVFPTMTSTLNLSWFISQFCETDLLEAERQGQSSWDYLESKVSCLPIGSGGVIYHPFIDLAGERAPFVKPTARAQFLGLDSQLTRYHLLRAVYEGITFSNADCYDYMPKPSTEIRLAGGGAKSEFWAQMHADVSGKVIKVMHGSEFGAKGAVINAGVAIGIYQDFDTAVHKCVKFRREFHPDLERHEMYQQVFALYRKAYSAVWEYWDERAAVFRRIYGG